MGSKIATAAAVIGVALLAATPAAAQTAGPEQPQQPDTPPEAKPPEPEPTPEKKVPAKSADEHHQDAMKHYSDGDYPAARDAFEAAYKADSNPRRLYAWAQAERYAGNCEGAVTLYDRALSSDLSRAQKKVILESKADCERIITEAKRLTSAELEKLKRDMNSAPTPPVIRNVIIKQVAPTVPWYKDPIGGALVGTGIIGVGVGAGFYFAARSSESSAKKAEDYGEYEDGLAAASRRQKIALISAATGAIVASAGVVWYIIRPNRSRDESERVSGWIGADGGGIAVSWDL